MYNQYVDLVGISVKLCFGSLSVFESVYVYCLELVCYFQVSSMFQTLLSCNKQEFYMICSSSFYAIKRLHVDYYVFYIFYWITSSW